MMADAANPPPLIWTAIPPQPAKAPIDLSHGKPVDIELVLQWALAQTGRLPWGGVSDLALAFDHGWTARPRSISGLSYVGGQLSLPRRLGDDAAIVIEAIKDLPAATAAVVVACAHSRIRPDWMPGVVAVAETRKTWTGRRSRRKRSTMTVWKPCRPEVIRAARDRYSEWHHGVTTLMATVSGALETVLIGGFAAPAEPWVEKSP